jgi:hypothetical protein
VRPEERVPAGGRPGDGLARELGAGRPGDRHPHENGVHGHGGEDDQAGEQDVPLQVRRRAEGRDGHDSEHGQEEPDEAATGIHFVADEGADGTAVPRRQIAIGRRLLLRLRAPRSPCRFLLEATLVGHGAPEADVDPDAR